MAHLTKGCEMISCAAEKDVLRARAEKAEAEVARLRDFLLGCMAYRTCDWCDVKVDRTVQHKGEWISEPNAHTKDCELVAVLKGGSS